MIDMSSVFGPGLGIAALATLLALTSLRCWTLAEASFGPHPAWAALLVRNELIVILAIAPVLLFPAPSRLILLAVVPVLWAAALATGLPVVARTPLNISLFALLAMVAVSLFVTPDLHFSLGKVSGVILGALLFLAIARTCSSRKRLERGLGVFVLVGVAFAILGLLGVNQAPKFFGITLPFPQKPLIRGIPGAEAGLNPNAISGSLVLFLPLQITLLMTRAARWLPISTLTAILVQLALLVPMLTAILYLQSRGAWLGLLAGLALGVLAYSRVSRVLAVTAVAAALASTATLGTTRLAAFVVERAGADAQATIELRMAIWSRAIDEIRAAPITGTGMNMLRKIMKPLPESFQLGTDGKGAGHDVVHAHNHLLQAALDLGLPGLIAYLAIWIGAAVMLTRVFVRSRDPLYRSAAAGLGAGLLAHFVFSTTDAIALGAKAGVLFWMTLGLTAALYTVSGAATRPLASATP